MELATLFGRWKGDVALAAGYALLAWIGVTFARAGTPVAALWLPNALMLGVLFQRASGRRLPFLLCPLAGYAAVLFGGIPAGLAGLRMIANMVEVGGVLWAMDVGGRRCELRQVGQIGRFTAYAAAASAVSAGVISLAPSLTPLFVPWFLAHALGYVILTPLICALVQAWHLRHEFGAARGREAVAIAVVSLTLTTALFAQPYFALLLLAGPLVIVASMRGGLFGATISILCAALAGTAMTLIGAGPVAALPVGLSAKLLTLQLFAASNVALGLPVAAIIAGLRDTRVRLRRSRDEAEATLASLREIVFRADDADRWTFLNPAWERVTGWKREESIGRSVEVDVHPDDLGAFRSLLRARRAGASEGGSMRLRFVHRGGALRHLYVSAHALRDPDGRVTGVSGSLRDVTDEVAAAAALRESEKRFATLSDLAPCGIFRTDASGACTYVNRAWCELAGVTEAAALGHGWADAIDPRDVARVAGDWTRTVAQSGRYRDEFRFRHADGTLVWVETMSTPERDASGTIIGYIGINIDITERTCAVAALADSEAQLTLLANGATDAVLRLALDGTCLYASPSVEEVMGVRPAALVGRSVLARFHPDDDMVVRDAFAEIASGRIDRLVLSHRSEPVDSPGEWRWLEASCGLLRDAAGRPQEVRVSTRDVSQRKKLELDLAAARDAAEVAATAKSSFLANMSHEIRTPMNGVVGATELLLADALTPDQRARVQVIADSGRAMMRLLNDILDLSKIDAGEMSIAAEAVDLRHALKGCARLMAPLAEQKGLAFALDIDEAVPARIEADSLRLRQIVLNLLGNAVKFTSTGGVTVRAGVVVADRHELLEIEVRDTGIGIARERHAAVFDHFVQSDAETARRFGGSGLGLSISAQLARLMAGTLSLDSEPGRGTSFVLRLPLVAVAEPAPVRIEAPAVGQIAPRSAGPLRVLLAEDNEVNQMLATAMLERLGAAVTLAVDGAAAVAAVDRSIAGAAPFHLVLMDMQMPRMDGVAATARLRADGHDAAALPILALTANAYADDVERCLAAGMQAHLAKPLRLADLEAAIARWARRDDAEAVRAA